MDHDANRQITYDEFCELTCVQEKPLRPVPQQQPYSPAVQNVDEEVKNESNV